MQSLYVMFELSGVCQEMDQYCCAAASNDDGGAEQGKADGRTACQAWRRGGAC